MSCSFRFFLFTILLKFICNLYIIYVLCDVCIYRMCLGSYYKQDFIIPVPYHTYAYDTKLNTT